MFYEDVTYQLEDENNSNAAGANTYISNQQYFWPQNGVTLDFYAASPREDWAGTFSDDAKEITDITPNSKIEDQKDLLYAYVQGSKKDVVGVEMELKHALAAIEIRALNTNENYVYRVGGIRIAHVVSKGDFTYPTVVNGNGTWSLSSEKAIYDAYNYNFLTVAGCNDLILTADAKNLLDYKSDNPYPYIGNAFLIPQKMTAWDANNDKKNTKKGAYLGVFICIQTITGEQVFPLDPQFRSERLGWVAMPIDIDWEAGKRYIYTLDFSNGAGYVAPEQGGYSFADPGGLDLDYGEPIGRPLKFTVEVIDWIDSSIDGEVS